MGGGGFSGPTFHSSEWGSLKNLDINSVHSKLFMLHKKSLHITHVETKKIFVAIALSLDCVVRLGYSIYMELFYIFCCNMGINFIYIL